MSLYPVPEVNRFYGHGDKKNKREIDIISVNIIDTPENISLAQIPELIVKELNKIMPAAKK